jgi:hypothetical protein
MAQILELPFEVIYDPYHSGRHFALKAEIVEWCYANLQGHYEVEYVRENVKMKKGRVHSYTMSFFGVFMDENDALLFKLRWL